MSLPARRELLASTAPRYSTASQSKKQQILDEFTASTGYHRKYAISLLNGIHPSGKERKRSERKVRYGAEVQTALFTLWEVAGRICSRRLTPFIPLLVEVLERHGYLVLPGAVKELLLCISPATVDRILAPRRKALGIRGRSTTLPGSLLKHQVPIRTFADWDDLKPGFVEADLVAHCGGSMAGSFLHSLVLTDVATGWTECLALPYRDQHTVITGIGVGKDRMPVPLLGLDTDNGSEFLNQLLIDYCVKESITFTRSRAYKKNDQCHVEEKNGSVVRRFVGYERFEGFAACRVLARLYESLRLYVNFFQPSMKLVSKERLGGKTKKKYDKSQAPCQRIIASDTVKNKVKMLLRRQFKQLDPVKLLEEIHRLQDELWTLAGVAADPQTITRRTSIGLPVSIHVGKMKTSENIKVIPLTGETSLAVKEKSSDRRFRKAKRKGRYHRVKHTWRTRADPFAGVWQEVEAQLREHPHFEAKRLFRNLQTRYPERFKEGQLRTMQRRVKAWRLRYARLVAEEVHLVLSSSAETITNTPQFNEPLDPCYHNPYKFQYKVMTGVPNWSG